MANFAELDENNIVIRVVVTNNDDPNGDEGENWLITNLGGRWIKTSYNTYAGKHNSGKQPLRKNFALPGYFYDATLDAFIPPQPFESWTLNPDTAQWEAPIFYPEGSVMHFWHEEKKNWLPIKFEEES